MNAAIYIFQQIEPISCHNNLSANINDMSKLCVYPLVSSWIYIFNVIDLIKIVLGFWIDELPTMSFCKTTWIFSKTNSRNMDIYEYGNQ